MSVEKDRGENLETSQLGITPLKPQSHTYKTE